MEMIQIRDFLQMKFLENLRLSPDGKYAAFIKRDCDEEQDDYPASLWCCETATGRLRELKGPRESGEFFTWEDGMILMAAPGQPSLGPVTCVRIDPATGRQEEAFTIPLPAKSIEPVGGGRYAVCAQTDLRELADREENGADWYALDELPFSSNGPGYATSLRRTSFFLYTPGERPMQVTDTWYHVEGCVVRADQGKAVLWGQSYRGKRSIMPGLAVVDLSNGAFRELIRPGIWRIEGADMLHGKILMCATQGKQYKISENANFYLVDETTCEPELYCEVDLMAKGLGVASDCRYGGGFDFMTRGGCVYFTACQMENCDLWEIPCRGKLRRMTHGGGSVDCFDIRGEQIWFVGMRGQGLQEVYSADREDMRECCRTAFNADFFTGHRAVVPEECSFINADGDVVQGWVLCPAEYVPGKSYPAILDIHGGPKTAYGTVYYHEMQVWSHRGYFVFFCNPRGSDGRGNQYGLLIGSYGTYDYDDIMAFTDTVLDRYPDIDRKRIGVTGGSYGGFMTNWIVTHTDRFAAAATQRSISNWILHEGACDSGYWFISHMYPPTSRIDPKGWEQSPIKYAGAVKTPLLIIQSDHDMRCHTGEGLSFYAQLVNNGVPVRMCLFRNETHELSRRGRPQSRIKRLEEITGWMERYLLLNRESVCHG